jgi:hypothetical protein
MDLLAALLTPGLDQSALMLIVGAVLGLLLARR